MAEVLHHQAQHDATVADRGLAMMATRADGPLSPQLSHSPQ
jgi:hypothetical protein